MKFTANKNYEGKEIELSKVQEVFVGSKSKKTKSNRELILEILERVGKVEIVLNQHTKVLNQHTKVLNQHTKMLNEHHKLFKKHGWMK